MIAKLLSILFPPHLPERIRNWEENTERTIEEQGSAHLIPTPLTGIEKHWAELKEHPSSYLPARRGKTNQIFTYTPAEILTCDSYGLTITGIYASIGGNLVPFVPAKIYHVQCVPKLKSA